MLGEVPYWRVIKLYSYLALVARCWDQSCQIYFSTTTNISLTTFVLLPVANWRIAGSDQMRAVDHYLIYHHRGDLIMLYYTFLQAAVACSLLILYSSDPLSWTQRCSEKNLLPYISFSSAFAANFKNPSQCGLRLFFWQYLCHSLIPSPGCTKIKMFVPFFIICNMTSSR